MEENFGFKKNTELEPPQMDLNPFESFENQ